MQSLVVLQAEVAFLHVGAASGPPALSSAVNPQHLPRHEGSLWPSEEFDHARNLVEGGAIRSSVPVSTMRSWSTALLALITSSLQVG